MEVKHVEIESLTEDAKNARTHGDRNIASIKLSLSRFGQQKPIVVTRDGVVVAGNGTLRAARELGWTTIAVVETDLDPMQAAAFGIADNRTAELADWDIPSLVSVLSGLDEEIQPATGFDPVEVEAFLSNKVISDDEQKFIDEGPASEPRSDQEFPKVDEVTTNATCPKCAYTWRIKE